MFWQITIKTIAGIIEEIIHTIIAGINNGNKTEIINKSIAGTIAETITKLISIIITEIIAKNITGITP